MSKFKKGQSGNRNGRPKGTPNKSTKETRELLQKVFDNEIEQVPSLLKQIKNPKDRLDILIKILPYILPKTQKETFDTNEHIHITVV